MQKSIERLNYSLTEYKKCGIYLIRNKLNDKLYIGYTTVSFNQRYRSHNTALRNNRHENQYLQNAYNKYNSKNFEFEVLEIISKNKVLKCFEEKEIAAIKSYSSYKTKNGYNLTLGGGGTLIIHPVYSYKIFKRNDKFSFEYYKTFNNNEAVKHYFNYNHPNKLVKGNIKSKRISKKFIFLEEFEKDALFTKTQLNIYLIEKYHKIQNRVNSSDNFKFKKPSKEQYVKMAKNREKKVYQFDLNNNILNIWNSLKEVSVFYNVKSIGAVLNNKKKTCVGCVFKYEKDIDINLIPFYIKESNNTSIDELKKYQKQEVFEKTVRMFTLDGTFIKSFKSISEAARYLKITPQCVSNNLRGKTLKVKKLYKFKYA